MNKNFFKTPSTSFLSLRYFIYSFSLIFRSPSLSNSTKNYDQLCKGHVGDYTVIYKRSPPSYRQSTIITMPYRRIKSCVHSDHTTDYGVCMPCVLKLLAIFINTAVTYQCDRKCIHTNSVTPICNLRLLEIYARNLRESMIKTIDCNSEVKLFATPGYLIEDVIQTILDKIVKETTDMTLIHDRIDRLRSDLPSELVNAIQVRAVAQCHDYLFTENLLFCMSELPPINCNDMYMLRYFFLNYFRKAKNFITHKHKFRHLPYRKRS